MINCVFSSQGHPRMGSQSVSSSDLALKTVYGHHSTKVKSFDVWVIDYKRFEDFHIRERSPHMLVIINFLPFF